ncbi:MAG: endopeptidase La [Bacilli bacterium]|nr:endopeptidase La [Bacilli bacterium]
MKMNLPVVLLKGLVLLPNNEIRLEFDGTVSKNVLDVAELFHDNNILVISQENLLEEIPKINELPRIGSIAKIIHKIELPNGNVRVVIKGKNRGKVHEYLNLSQGSDVLEAIVSEIIETSINENEEIILTNKLYREVEEYIKGIPYISNNILGTVENIKSLSEMTDVLASFLPIKLDRIQEYLYTDDVKKRATMILEDIYDGKKIYDIEKSIEQKVKTEIDSNQKEYLLREKLKAIKEELGDISSKDDEIEKLKEQTKKLDAPEKIIERLNSEISRYEGLSQTSPEANIVRTYVDWLLNLPWNVHTLDNENLKEVRKKLDESHYGLEKVKIRIVEYLAVKQMTNSLRSPILCLVGPPGVGKTSLAFSIASAINRNFVKMSVGGVHDESEVIGHRRAYIGASPGRIIQSLKKAKSSNPVFLIDEIDKMTKDFKGDPASCLLEVLDPEQNKYFSDNYIEEDYDLSNVMFIATANYIDDIPEALQDRLEIVRLSGYTEFEKLDIAKRHLIAKICNEHGLKPSKIYFSDDIILHIIRSYTKEAGVRELERQLSNIVRKIVADIVIDNVEKDKYRINIKLVTKYLGKVKYKIHEINKLSKVGVVNGLAYTSFGGDTLPIEVNYYEGKGNLVLTGSLGDIMKESAHIALSYIKSNYKYYGIDYDKLTKNDIHIHVPEGAIPKDGPSAGITLTTALISAFTSKEIPANLAMTGEITLRGNILPIGGLKEKSIGANRNGIKKIIIPYENLSDLEEIPNEIKDNIDYIAVKNYEEVINAINEEKVISKV